MKKIVKLIKDSKLKVQAQIQAKKFCVTGKSRDDLGSLSWRWCAAAIHNRSSFLKLPRLNEKARLNWLFFQLSAPVQLQSGLSPYCLF